MKVLLYSFALVSLASFASAHYYLAHPPPRGIRQETFPVDALKAPNYKNITCRGEPEGVVIPVKPGQTLTLGFVTPVPHIGNCWVTVLDPDLNTDKAIFIAQKYDCLEMGKQYSSWDVTLPSEGMKGKKVVRWFMEALHLNPHELYDQCIDVDFSANASAVSSGEVVRVGWTISLFIMVLWLAL
jgi:hypothetical protein